MKLADRGARRRSPARTGLRFGVVALASGALVASAVVVLTRSHGATNTLALAGSASTAKASSAGSFQFLTLNDNRDRTFNQLLGINNEGVIAGYFGSGAKGHPNKGYELRPPFGQSDFRNENFPHSVQTQVTGLNDNGITVGFWSKTNNKSQVNNNFGFFAIDDRFFFNVNFPTSDNAKPPVNQLLGVNNNEVAVGFYTNGQGSNRGYEFNIHTRKFTRVLPPGTKNPGASASLTAAAINNHGDVAGFYNKTASQVDGFLRLHTGRFITLAFPGAAMTQAVGVNDADEVVGTYTDGSGSSATTHGFTWRAGHFTTVNDPNGVGATTINGVNNEGDLVGFYTDSAGNTDGLVALP